MMLRVPSDRRPLRERLDVAAPVLILRAFAQLTGRLPFSAAAAGARVALAALGVARRQSRTQAFVLDPLARAPAALEWEATRNRVGDHATVRTP